MNTRDRATLRAYLSAIVVVGELLNHIIAARTANKKWKRLTDRKIENVACIENAYDRLIKMAMDPNCNADAFINALKEDAEFLEIIRKQES